MSKVKFSRLSPDQQKQFGYDSAKAKDYEAKVAKATEDCRQESIRWEQAKQGEIAAQKAPKEQEERIVTDRIMAMAQLKQAEANLERATDSNGGYGWSSLGGGYGLFGQPRIDNDHSHDHDHRAKTEGIQSPRHTIFPGINPVHASR